jgi:hypothetical protein
MSIKIINEKDLYLKKKANMGAKGVMKEAISRVAPGANVRSSSNTVVKPISKLWKNALAVTASKPTVKITKPEKIKLTQPKPQKAETINNSAPHLPPSMQTTKIYRAIPKIDLMRPKIDFTKIRPPSPDHTDWTPVGTPSNIGDISDIFGKAKSTSKLSNMRKKHDAEQNLKKRSLQDKNGVTQPPLKKTKNSNSTSASIPVNTPISSALASVKIPKKKKTESV